MKGGNYSTLDYIREEYVEKSGNTTIDFVELMAVALEERGRKLEIDPKALESKAEQIKKMIAESGNAAIATAGIGIEYLGSNEFKVKLKNGKEAVYDFVKKTWTATGKNFSDFKSAYEKISKEESSPDQSS